MKNGVKYEYMSNGKMSDFVSSPLFGLTLVRKLRAFNFESNWNTSMFFDKKKIWRQIWICHVEKCIISLISIVWMNFSNKTVTFWVRKSLKSFKIFSSKKMMSDLIWICPAKQCLIWFKLSCLSKTLAISWEIRILNFNEIV